MRGVLALFSACLAALVVYLALPGAGAPALASCAGRAPDVAQVAPQGLGALREAVAGVLPERLGRLYEEGPVPSATAWREQRPEAPSVSPGRRRPGGYEMRWWAPDGDDVVADVFVFADSRAAARYAALAASVQCRRGAREQPIERPARARAISWVNPTGTHEVDLYLTSGSRVYRVADAPTVSARFGPHLERALQTIEILACLLPDAGCAPRTHGVPS